jgi:adenylosuccinate synthase
MVDFIKSDVGNIVMVAGGRNTGHVSRTGRSTRVAMIPSTLRMP